MLLRFWAQGFGACICCLYLSVCTRCDARFLRAPWLWRDPITAGVYAVPEMAFIRVGNRSINTEAIAHLEVQRSEDVISQVVVYFIGTDKPLILRPEDEGLDELRRVTRTQDAPPDSSESSPARRRRIAEGLV